jgi:hypothetical protein
MSIRIWAAVVWVCACGGSDGDTPPGGGSPDAAALGTDAGDSAPSLDERVAAADTAATSDPACTGLGDFYWQIGDAEAAVGEGAIGSDYGADTLLEIASGSKLIWGAYVVERFADDMGGIDLDAMTMRSGYTGFEHCPGALTVAGCFQAGGNQHVEEDDGFYFYGGGHFQKYAVDLGLGAKGKQALADEIQRLLGDDLDIAYWIPEPAAGVETTPAVYARFLRKILAGELAIAEDLGGEAVCTLPAACDEAHDTPVPEAWHYSYGHWVEDDPDGGDGAFSSPGAFGFYPWIDASRSWYGIVARKETSDDAYLESVACGQAIRRAFTTGAP